MGGGHARLSASGSKKWINCPKSVELESCFPNNSSAYAIEGTTAHSLGELKIKLALGTISKRTYSQSINTLCIDSDMEAYADEYKEYVMERFNDFSGGGTLWAEIYTELKLDFGKWVKGGFGTGDIILLNGTNLEIIDLKYGAGMKVNALNNPQLRLYALGALCLFCEISNIETVTMTIFQPRLNHIDIEVLTVGELLAFGDYVKHRADLVDSEEAQCVAGNHCDEGFCRARPLCKVYTQSNTRLINHSNKHPNLLTDDELIDVLSQADSLGKWVKIVKEYALQEALKGKKYEGLKLVCGKSNRKFIDDIYEVENALKGYGLRQDDIYKTDLKPLGEIEKLIGKNVFNEELKSIWIKPQGAPALVDVSDKRAEIGSLQSQKDSFEQILKNIEN